MEGQRVYEESAPQDFDELFASACAYVAGKREPCYHCGNPYRMHSHVLFAGLVVSLGLSLSGVVGLLFSVHQGKDFFSSTPLVLSGIGLLGGPVLYFVLHIHDRLCDKGPLHPYGARILRAYFLHLFGGWMKEPRSPELQSTWAMLMEVRNYPGLVQEEIFNGFTTLWKAMEWEKGRAVVREIQTVLRDRARYG